MPTTSSPRPTRASISVFWRAAAPGARSARTSYTTIRNLASTWGAAVRDITVDDMTAFEGPATTEDPAAIALIGDNTRHGLGKRDHGNDRDLRPRRGSRRRWYRHRLD